MIDMEPKKYYKLYIINKDNKQQFHSENFKTMKDAKECFKTIEHLAIRACIMEYENYINTRNWFWGDEYKKWV